MKYKPETFKHTATCFETRNEYLNIING